jgi:hypothetical protein
VFSLKRGLRASTRTGASGIGTRGMFCLGLKGSCGLGGREWTGFGGATSWGGNFPDAHVFHVGSTTPSNRLVGSFIAFVLA